jgi:hypothetical protein
MATHDDGLRELYANYFQVGYNAVEFLLYFGRSFEDSEDKFYERIITTPGSAKTFSRILEKSIRGYEEKFGAIPEDQGS